ncbi:MAG: hypothetical protein AABZ47_14895, partial [Planctomycetota bacterium]
PILTFSRRPNRRRLKSYQEGINDGGGNRDGDPDILINNSTAPLGPFWTAPGYSETVAYGGTASSGERPTMAYRAPMTDWFQYFTLEEQTIAHEIGHSTGNLGDATSHHAEGGLMGEEIGETDTDFTGLTLKRFRETIKW